MAEEDVQTCEACGASIYPEHLRAGRAKRVGGRLLCMHCVHDAEAAAPPPAPAAVQLEPLPLVDAPTTARPDTSTLSASRPSGAAVTTAPVWNESRFARPLNPAGGLASRCRVFHCKLNDGAIAFMNEQINAWTDSHPEINIKVATSTIGVFEGKHSDPNLIITVFY